MFGPPAPKWKIFGPQIASFYPTGASHNDKNQSKYLVTAWNRTYIPIATHFSEHRRVFGKLLSDFWSASPKMEDILPPDFALFIPWSIA